MPNIKMAIELLYNDYEHNKLMTCVVLLTDQVGVLQFCAISSVDRK